MKTIYCILLISILACCGNAVDNTITFVDEPKAVEDSLLKFRSIALKIKDKGFNNCFINYQNCLVINEVNFGKIDTANYYDFKDLDSLTISEKKSIKTLLLFLNKNYIKGGVFSNCNFDFTYERVYHGFLSGVRDKHITTEFDCVNKEFAVFTDTIGGMYFYINKY